MLLRMGTAWCIAVTVLLLATVGGFRAVECLYAGIYAAQEDVRTAPWIVVATYPHHFPDGVLRGVVPLSGSVRVEQSFQTETEQHIAGIEVHAIPSANPDRPRVCGWSLLERSADSSMLLREGTCDLVQGYGFLRIYFPRLVVRADCNYELVLHGPGDGSPEGLVLPLFEIDRPWGVLRVRANSASAPIERADTCLRMRLLETPPPE
jgi:hypothetical protein